MIEQFLQPWQEERLVPNFSEDDYHPTIAMSSGKLKYFIDSTPAHFMHSLQNPSDVQTPAMRFGWMVHKAILEGPEFRDRLRVMPEFSGTGSRAAKAAWLADQGPSAIVADQEEVDQITAMLSSLMQNPAAKLLISGNQDRKELTGLFNRDGIRCKLRADIFPNDDMIVDVKTAIDGSPGGFMKAAWDMRYPIQAAWYLSGASKILGKPVKTFVYLVIEKKPPYAVAVYTASVEFLSFGEAMMEIAFNRFKKCLTEDSWPAYPSKAMNLTVPYWADREMQELQNMQGELT